MTTPALTLTMTNAGLARFTAAQLGNATDLRISEVGLSDAAIFIAPTLTALPGEFRRVATISGKQVGDNIVHLVVRDDVPLQYGIRAIGLYLSDGTLFAVYGQAARIMEKATAASTLLAIDIAFPAANVATVTFGDTNFLLPPATTETAGLIEIATDAEAIAGTDDKRAVTPKGLAARLAPIVAAIAGFVGVTRRIDTAGLATGGGALDADRTIRVEVATAIEADAGALTTKALVPASLVNILASILARVPLTRRIDTAGLATGGGTLLNDRTITVSAASAAQMRAGVAGDVAATPSAVKDAGFIYVVRSSLVAQNGYREWSDGFIEQWGFVDTNITNERAFTIAFPIPFVSECFGVSGTARNTTQSTVGSHQVQEVSIGLTEATVFLQSDQTTTSDAAGGFRWRATGR